MPDARRWSSSCAAPVRPRCAKLVGVVEEVLGRKVAAFMSDHHLDPDMAVEVFVLKDGEGGD